ncbi:hypothetical protein [Flexithrix dorotheae]|uniref:hypothetical protein n=1 Tax=Flexithrix dorotheae TaxID=70993 RepID=UPI0003651233|nr:hypothetical protein [Flexithrix dorotheae]
MVKQFSHIIFLTFLFFCCNKEEVKEVTVSKNEIKKLQSNEINSSEYKPIDKTFIKNSKSLPNWDSLQDSIRKKILDQKENEFLKSGIFQELYIRNLVYQEKDSLRINIPFDLHSLDCGAPDCYTTFLRFSIKADYNFKLLNTIPFQELEQGCISSEDTISGTFKLKDANKTGISLYNQQYQRLLLILKEDPGKEFVYYFQGVNPEAITQNTLNNYIENLYEEDENLIVPLRSTWLIKNDYREFLK